MANETMVLLEKIVVPSGGASSVTFTSIPQSYTDLQIVLSARQSVAGGTNVNMKFNGSSSGYTNRNIISAAGTVASESSVLGTSSIKIGFIPENVNYTASTFSNQYVYIPNYAGSNNKSVSTDNAMENNSTSVYFGLFAGLWSNSSAITSIDFTPENGSFVQYSTFYLYGVAKQGVTPTNAPAATGGDSIVFDGTYWIHTFTSSGTFTPKKNLTADCLVVAGGGGGGGWSGGGGGGGGLLTFTAQSLALNTSFTVTVGAGGSGNTNGGSGTGSDSQFGTLTLVKGGGYGGGGNGNQASRKGGDGGSSGGGGGAGTDGSGAGQSGSATSGQGSAGGDSGTSPSQNTRAGGGGGGANATGANASGNTAGNGGNGISNSYSGSAVTYAGGGGGGTRNNSWGGGSANVIGTGGSGGGGNGGGAASADTGSNGTANLGGGGGGGSYSYTGGTSTGGNGGSGIVIVRYTA